MSIKVIIELHAHPGHRSEVVDLVDEILPAMDDVPGFIGLTRYEVLDEPDKIVEIVEWKSPESRGRWLAEASESGILEPLEAALATPSRVTSIRLLD